MKTKRLSKKDGLKIVQANKQDLEDFIKKFHEHLEQREKEKK